MYSLRHLTLHTYYERGNDEDYFSIGFENVLVLEKITRLLLVFT
jgi:hypothetical protein